MKNKKEIIRVFEGFAGYGGASYAMKRINKSSKEINFQVIGYSEICKSAIDLYNENHKQKDGTLIKNWGGGYYSD